MKINPKYLSIPPYISASWDNISALHMQGTTLVINTVDGNDIEIPDLKPEILEAIFAAHANYLESYLLKDSEASSVPPIMKRMPQLFSSNDESDQALRLSFGAFDSLGTMMQHNSAQANGPNLPKEVLNKISAIAKIISPEEAEGLPKPELHCNCVHCQIARAIHEGLHTELQQQPILEEEIVSEKDLSFQQWDISQTGDQLYSVVNRLDTEEKYSVYLGHPVGCTCGKSGCEHILAVLKT